MMYCGFEPNILVLTSLVSCYGKAKRTNDAVRIFDQLLDLGIKPDNRLWDCLLYVMTPIPKQEHGKITDCIEKANSSVVESNRMEHNAPFQKDTDMAGWFLTMNEAAKSWLQSRASSEKDAALNSRVLGVPNYGSFLLIVLFYAAMLHVVFFSM